MHARDLLELAGLVAACGATLVESCRQIPLRAVVQYWTATKMRQERWNWTLKNAPHYLGAACPLRPHRSSQLYGSLEEIFSAEPLVRICAALFTAYDRLHDGNERSPLVLSALRGQAEARHRALCLLVQGSQMDAAAAARLDRLRQRGERWSDLLLSHIAPLGDVAEFAFDAERMKDFAETSRSPGTAHQEPYPWPLLLGSLRSAFAGQFDCASPNADLNAGIAAGVLACFPREALEKHSFSHSLWLVRLLAEADEAQYMLDSLTGASPAEAL